MLENKEYKIKKYFSIYQVVDGKLENVKTMTYGSRYDYPFDVEYDTEEEAMSAILESEFDYEHFVILPSYVKNKK